MVFFQFKMEAMIFFVLCESKANGSIENVKEYRMFTIFVKYHLSVSLREIAGCVSVVHNRSTVYRTLIVLTGWGRRVPCRTK